MRSATKSAELLGGNPEIVRDEQGAVGALGKWSLAGG